MDKSEKGYVLAVAEDSGFYIPGALHIERNDDLMLYDSDEQASEAAEQDGVKLIRGMEHIPDGVYLDTPENRTVIAEQLIKYPEYKDVPIHGRVLEQSEPSLEMGMCFGKDR